MDMIQYSQSTQSNKFEISLQYLIREVRDGAHFVHLYKHQSFYKLALSFLMARHVQSSKNRKLEIFLQYIKKKCRNCFVFYCDAKYSDILRGSSHVCCCLFQTMQLKVENCMLLIICFVLLQPHTARENVGRKALGNFKHFLFILWTENGLRNKIVWLFEIRLAFVEHCRSYVKNIHEKEFKIQNIDSA